MIKLPRTKEDIIKHVQELRISDTPIDYRIMEMLSIQLEALVDIRELLDHDYEEAEFGAILKEETNNTL